MNIIKLAKEIADKNQIVSWAQNYFANGEEPINLTDKQKTVLKDHQDKERHYIIDRAGGKSTLIIIESLYDALHKPKSIILVFSQSQVCAKLLRTRALSYINHLPHRDNSILHIGQNTLDFENGSKIYFLSKSRMSNEGLRGISLYNKNKEIFIDDASMVDKSNGLIYARAIDAKIVTYGYSDYILNTQNNQ